ncbi:MAG: peptidoglycan-binding protein [Minisyncoccales bacterium]
MKRKIFKILILIITAGILFSLAPGSVLADHEGDKDTFYVSQNYDELNREKVDSTLIKTTSKLYFYIEDDWYHSLSEKEKEEINSNLEKAGEEFKENIYPEMTENYGEEWKSGIDDDLRITVLFHKMDAESAGYFNSGDEYEKTQNPRSNEREMFYLNTEYAAKDNLPSYLAHEFTHLITFNQKTKERGIEEEVWLNEARAEYAPTLVGYDENYEGSNLENRVNTFISNPDNSLTKWEGVKEDYGVLNLFTQYLVDHYGVEILEDSLKSAKSGIPSINSALKENDYEIEFSEIFKDWTTAVFLNDCSVNEKYCYKNDNLKGIKISPSLIFLPLRENGSVETGYITSEWSGRWYKIIGDKGELKIEFEGKEEKEFKVSFIKCDENESCEVENISLDENQNGTTTISGFGEEVSSFTFLPLLTEGEDVPFTIKATIGEEADGEKIEELKAKIEELKAKIEQIKKEIAQLKGESCNKIDSNLKVGMENNEVECLQAFLKNQGEDIYPEGLVTGYFGNLTKDAVIRFQEKYKEEILGPYNLEKGTGYVGKTTKSKINELIDS